MVAMGGLEPPTPALWKPDLIIKLLFLFNYIEAPVAQFAAPIRTAHNWIPHIFRIGLSVKIQNLHVESNLPTGSLRPTADGQRI